MRIIIICLLLLSFKPTFAQNKSGNTWVLGGWVAATATFTDTSRPIIYPRFTTPPLYFTQGHSNICDSATGKLLFSCNGMILYDSNCVMMENGDSLVPVKAYTHNAFPNGMLTQNSLILPKGTNSLYYVFVVSVTDSLYNAVWNTQLSSERAPFNILMYHIVDINANNGLGKVISKNNVLFSGKEMHKIGMMACRHANGRDWWLLKQGQYDTNQVIRFLVTPDSIAGPWIQNVTMTDLASYPKTSDLSGQYAFSPNGEKFAYVKQKCQQLYLADFDRCTGELNNSKLINIPIDTTPNLDPKYKYDSLLNGVCFSPNGQFVYISKRWNIYQYEHNQPDSSLAWYHVKQGPDTTYQKFQGYSSLHRGIDKRIYIGNFAAQYKQMSVIDKPDVKGVGCSFCRKCFRLDDTTYMGFGAPPDMPDFTLGPSNTTCWPLANPSIENNREALLVYPNPSHTTFYFKNKTGQHKYLYNTLGQLIRTTQSNEMDVRGLHPGVYYVQCDGETRKVIIE